MPEPQGLAAYLVNQNLPGLSAFAQSVLFTPNVLICLETTTHP